MYHFLRLTALLFFSTSLCVAQTEEVAQEPVRTWTNSEGNSIVGRLLDIDGDSVQLKVKGKDFEVSLSSLSKADQDHIAKWKERSDTLKRENEELSTALTSDLITIRHDGMFQILSGELKVIGEPEEYEDDPALQPGLVAKPGHTIVVEQGTDLRMYASSGASLRVRPEENTETRIKVPGPAPDEPKMSLELLKGNLFLNVDGEELKKERREFRLKTPTAILAVKGTKFFANAKEGRVVAGVSEGEISATLEKGETLKVEAGYAVEIVEGKASIRPLKKEEKAELSSSTEKLVQLVPLTDRVWDWTWNWEAHFDEWRQGYGADKYSKAGITEKRLSGKVFDVTFTPEKLGGKWISCYSSLAFSDAGLGDRILGAKVNYRLAGMNQIYVGMNSNPASLKTQRISDANIPGWKQEIERLKDKIKRYPKSVSINESLLRERLDSFPALVTKETLNSSFVFLQPSDSWEIYFGLDHEFIAQTGSTPIQLTVEPPLIILEHEDLSE